MNRKPLETTGRAALVAGPTLGIVLLLLALVFAWVFYRETSEEYASRRDFDPVAWQDSAEAFAEEPVRIDMIDDLLRRHSFEGMTRSEVLALLGKPEDTPYVHEYDLVYWLGPERSPFGVDSEWLIFRLDGAGIVTGALVATD